uniref:Uncharacterized protein n=1 Tax=Leersia perrieri TaxID=77586 RepID=A0A0D9X9S4_9ORYZ
PPINPVAPNYLHRQVGPTLTFAALDRAGSALFPFLWPGPPGSVRHPSQKLRGSFLRRTSPPIRHRKRKARRTRQHEQRSFTPRGECSREREEERERERGGPVAWRLQWNLPEASARGGGGARVSVSSLLRSIEGGG